MNNTIFYCLTAGFTLGILISSFIKMGFSFFLFLLILASLIFIFGKYLAKEKGLIIFIGIFIFSFSLGILRYEIKDLRNEEGNLKMLVGEKINIRGIVTDEPVVKDQTVQLVIETDSLEKVLVSTGLFPAFKYGDLLEIEGKLEKPENFATKSGQDFDYINYLDKEDIYYQISFAQARLIESGRGSVIKSSLFSLKESFIGKINVFIKEPESALLGGLLLGAKNSLGQELQTDFRQAGVSHIVALSGYNITIVAVGIMTILSFLPKTLSLSGGVLGILAFAIMTGGSATVLRASIMALLVLLAKQTNRRYDITRALLLAGVFMIIQNPKILVFDLSFQLSFLATMALIWVAPLVERKVQFITPKYKLRELVVSTIATQIFVLPFIIYKMGLLSIFALFANVLILPAIPIIMFLGFLVGSLCFISTVLTVPVSFVCTLLLTYVLKIIYLFSHLPFSSVTIESFPLVLVIIIYLLLFIIIWQSRKNETA